MNSRAANHRPPSPPHSNDGDDGNTASKIEHFQTPFTPPRTIRPASHAELAYGPYGTPPRYPPVPQQVYYSPQPTFARQMQYHTPPHGQDPGIMTRSGKTLGSPMEAKHLQDRVSRSPKQKRNKNNRHSKKGHPIIDQPLSMLTKDYQIPVRDMGEWVHRPVEERLKEVEKKKGYVSRPMNSFMLYRSAYADRVKQFCKENNHQVVSQVTGQSWPLEPSHVREMYEQYAIIERDNHAAAHPTYKFAPNKSGKKRGRDDNDDSDSDDEWKGPRSSKRSRPGARGGNRSMSSTPFDPDRPTRFTSHMYHQAPQPHPSSYQAMNPHGPPPFSFDPAGMSGGYYQPQTLPYGEQVDDIRFARIDDPFATYNPGSQLIGMPDGNHNELLGMPDGVDEGIPVEHMLDPRLAHFDPTYGYGPYDGPAELSYQAPRSYGYGHHLPPAEASGGSEQVHPGLATLTEGWTDEADAGSDFDNEFRKWS